MAPAAPRLDNQLLEQLWALAEPDEARSDPLGALFATWCRTVGYDTTAKIAGIEQDPDATLWGLDPDELVGAALTAGYGGTCFPLAAGFAAAARSSGWDATVHAAHSRGADTPADHAVVVVTDGPRRMLCDPAFVHLRPAPIGTRVGQRSIVGPTWAPLHLERTTAGVEFTVERGASTQRRRYQLGRPLERSELRRVYEEVGRWRSGVTPYVRRVRRHHQVVVGDGHITTKGAGGLHRQPLDMGHLEAQLGAALGIDGIALDDLCAQLRAHSEPGAD